MYCSTGLTIVTFADLRTIHKKSFCSCLIVESFVCCVKSVVRKFISTVDTNPFLAAKSGFVADRNS